MPFDINAIKAKVAATPRRTVQSANAKADPANNPWLNKDWEQGLWASYENDEADSAPFKGAIEKVPAKRGANKGEPIDKVTGEAAEAVSLIRTAASVLGIGVSIRTIQVMHANGNPKTGYLEVVWYGKTPKNTKPKNDESAATGVVPSEVE